VVPVKNTLSWNLLWAAFGRIIIAATVIVGYRLPNCTPTYNIDWWTYRLRPSLTGGPSMSLCVTWLNKLILGITWTSTVAHHPSGAKLVGQWQQSFHLWCFAIYTYIVLLEITEKSLLPVMSLCFLMKCSLRFTTSILHISCTCWW